jgi:DNA-binding GntR family transcriptional regulator
MTTELSADSVASLPLSKIQKTLVTDHVESQLRDAILLGALKPGEPLAEARLATQLGVSRASVRQAKFQLHREGLLEFDHRGTATVRTLTEADSREIIEFRQTLELGAARLAARSLTEESAAALEATIRRTEQDGDLLTLTHLDIAFHEEIVRAACNSRLMEAWRNLRPQLELWLAGKQRQHSAVTARTRAETANGHRLLLVALRSGDPDRAEQVMRQHTAFLRDFC